MNFKNKNGFTITEALISLAIVGMVLTPIFILYGNATRLVKKSGRLYDRTLSVYNFLLESSLALKPQEKSISVKEPVMNLSYAASKLAENSAFKKIPNVQLNKVTGQWQEGRKKRDMQLVFYSYKKEEKEEKKNQ